MKHLAIIMDWNRRWARERYLPAIFWHKAGYDNIQVITREAKNLGIQYLTIWALSTENLKKRESDEIEGIIKLIHHAIKLLPDFQKDGVKLQVIGDISKLPSATQEILVDLQFQTKDNTSIILTTALVYGWQDEIVRATKKIMQSWVDPESLNEIEFRKYLDTSILPPPDLIIRTWWDIRHSWFLLYDSAYCEYYFTDMKWPEFDIDELHKAYSHFNTSQRNFWV